MNTEDWPGFNGDKRSVDSLIPYARNARQHSADQVRQIARSISEWGFTMPVLIDEVDGIIAGHGRVMAAKELRLTHVPVIIAKGWSDAKKRAYVLADNKLAENASWNDTLLQSELSALNDMGVDLSITGFSDKEISSILGEEDGGEVKEIPSTPIDDRFWISIRGPLADQADVLQKIRILLEQLPAVEVEIGTIGIDE